MSETGRAITYPTCMDILVHINSNLNGLMVKFNSLTRKDQHLGTGYLLTKARNQFFSTTRFECPDIVEPNLTDLRLPIFQKRTSAKRIFKMVD